MPKSHSKHSLAGTHIIAGNKGPRSYQKKWLFFFVLIAFSGFVIYEQRVALEASFYAGDYQEMIVLLVLLFPLFFAFKVLAKGNHYRRFGDTPLTINPAPLVLGRRFNGSISITRGAKWINNNQFSAELRLCGEVEEEQGDHYITQVETLLKLALKIVAEHGAIGARLLVEGNLPDDQPASSAITNDISDGASRYFWRLSVISSDKKFRQSWDIPVAPLN